MTMPDTETSLFIVGVLALACADFERRDGHPFWMLILGIAGLALMVASVYMVHVNHA